MAHATVAKPVKKNPDVKVEPKEEAKRPESLDGKFKLPKFYRFWVTVLVGYIPGSCSLRIWHSKATIKEARHHWCNQWEREYAETSNMNSWQICIQTQKNILIMS